MKLNAGRKEAESERGHGVAARDDRYAKTLPVSHSLVAIHRLMEMGYFKI